MSASRGSTAPRPFRFAVQAYQVPTAAEWRDFARKAEQLGYSTLHVADHTLDRGISRQLFAPIASMAAAAAVTETIRIGCRVFCVDYHVPASLAKEAATLDVLSDGRLEFGIGAGYVVPEYEAMGVPFESGARRLRKLKEFVAFLKAHWSGEDLDCHGEFVNVSGYAGLPVPVQKPRPPILIGGNGTSILSFAAREADIVSYQNIPFVPVNEAGLTPRGEAARRFAVVRKAAGDRFADLEIETSPYFTEVTEDPDEPLARLAERFGMPTEGLGDHPNVLIGPASEIEERLMERREMCGVSYVTVQQAQVDAFAPIVARLAGK